MTLCKHISREMTLMQKDDNKSCRYLVVVYRQLCVSRQEYLLFRQSTPAQKFMTLFAGAQRITGAHITGALPYMNYNTMSAPVKWFQEHR